MIAAKLHHENGTMCLMLVLEPGNIEKLKEGKPIHKWLSEFFPELGQKIELLFCYTPDAAWVAERMKGCEGDALKLATLIEESLTRKPVVVRGRTAEEMKQVQ